MCRTLKSKRIYNQRDLAYSRKWPDGKKFSRNIYAYSLEECEKMLATLIVQMKAGIAEAMAKAEKMKNDIGAGCLRQCRFLIHCLKIVPQ